MKCNYCGNEVSDTYNVFTFRWYNVPDGWLECDVYYFCDPSCTKQFIEEEGYIPF